MDVFKAYWEVYIERVFKDLPYAVSHPSELWQKLTDIGFISIVLILAVIIAVFLLIIWFWNTVIAGEHQNYRLVERRQLFSDYTYLEYEEREGTHTNPSIRHKWLLKAAIVIAGLCPLVFDFFWLRYHFEVDVWGSIWRSLLFLVMRVAASAVIGIISWLLLCLALSYILAFILAVLDIPFHFIKTFFVSIYAKRKDKKLEKKWFKINNKIVDCNTEQEMAKYRGICNEIKSERQKFLEEHNDIINDTKSVYKSFSFPKTFNNLVHNLIKKDITPNIVSVIAALFVLIIYFAPLTIPFDLF